MAIAGLAAAGGRSASRADGAGGAGGRLRAAALRPAGGPLLHAWRAGAAKIPAFLADYAFLVHGLLALHEATGEARWLDAAAELTREQIARLGDEEGRLLRRRREPGPAVPQQGRLRRRAAGGQRGRGAQPARAGRAHRGAAWLAEARRRSRPSGRWSSSSRRRADAGGGRPALRGDGGRGGAAGGAAAERRPGGGELEEPEEIGDGAAGDGGGGEDGWRPFRLVLGSPPAGTSTPTRPLNPRWSRRRRCCGRPPARRRGPAGAEPSTKERWKSLALSPSMRPTPGRRHVPAGADQSCCPPLAHMELRGPRMIGRVG